MPFGGGQLGALSPLLLSLQNKIGAAIYLDGHNDANALTRAASAFVVSDEFPAIEIWQGKRNVARIKATCSGSDGSPFLTF